MIYLKAESWPAWLSPQTHADFINQLQRTDLFVTETSLETKIFG